MAYVGTGNGTCRADASNNVSTIASTSASESQPTDLLRTIPTSANTTTSCATDASTSRLQPGDVQRQDTTLTKQVLAGVHEYAPATRAPLIATTTPLATLLLSSATMPAPCSPNVKIREKAATTTPPTPKKGGITKINGRNWFPQKEPIIFNHWSKNNRLCHKNNQFFPMIVSGITNY